MKCHVGLVALILFKRLKNAAPRYLMKSRNTTRIQVTTGTRRVQWPWLDDHGYSNSICAHARAQITRPESTSQTTTRIQISFTVFTALLWSPLQQLVWPVFGGSFYTGSLDPRRILPPCSAPQVPSSRRDITSTCLYDQL